MRERALFLFYLSRTILEIFNCMGIWGFVTFSRRVFEHYVVGGFHGFTVTTCVVEPPALSVDSDLFNAAWPQVHVPLIFYYSIRSSSIMKMPRYTKGLVNEHFPAQYNE